MPNSFTQNKLAIVNDWVDPALLPAYLIAGLAIFFTVRYIDNKWIRPPSKTGFGKGAPGFMTNTRQLKVTPEIAARLRNGEHVPPEEIEAAVRIAEAKREASSPSKDKKSEEDTDEPAKRPVTRSQMKKKSASPTKHVADSQPVDSNANEWIPETHLKKGPQGRRKR